MILLTLSMECRLYMKRSNDGGGVGIHNHDRQLFQYVIIGPAFSSVLVVLCTN